MATAAKTPVAPAVPLIVALMQNKRPTNSSRLVEIVGDAVQSGVMGTTEVLSKSWTGIDTVWHAAAAAGEIDANAYSARLLQRSVDRAKIGMTPEEAQAFESFLLARATQ